MPRGQVRAKRAEKTFGKSFLADLFAKRGLDFKSYLNKQVQVERAAIRGVFFDFVKSVYGIDADQFVQGSGHESSPDLVPIFNKQLVVLTENNPDADLLEIYHRRGHQILLSDKGDRTFVLITNFKDWEVFNVTGPESKYSLNLLKQLPASPKAAQKLKPIKAFADDFISARSKIAISGGTSREALKVLRFGKFPTAQNPLPAESNILGVFSIGPNDLLAVFKDNQQFRKKEEHYKETFRSKFGNTIYLTFAVVAEPDWLIQSPYLEREIAGSYKNILPLKDAFSTVMNSALLSRKEVIRKKIDDLVKIWNQNTKSYYEDDEAQTRKNFLDDILKALGYRLQADGAGREEVYLETTGTSDGRPDYAVKVDGRVIFFFEAKKPKVNCSEWSNCSQAVRYSWSRGNVPIAILSNFREFKVLLAKTNPTEDNYNQLIIPDLDFSSPNRAAPLDSTSYQVLSDYLLFLSRESVAAGRFDEWLQEIGATIPESIPVTSRFLDTVNDFRLTLAEGLPKAIAANAGLVNLGVNQLLNRILFIRVAEDRRVLEDRLLWTRLKKWETRGKKRISLHEELVQFFREIEDHFNAGLFKSHDLLESIPFSDKSLSHVIENLYLPHTEYHFAVLRPEIIGVAYEQALAQKITYTPSLRPKLVEKDDLQSENGIYYTPEFIVDYIVKQTIRPHLEINGLNEDLRLADISCGSGAFLVAAYRELLRFEKEYLENNPAKAIEQKKLAQLKRGGQEFHSVSIQRRREILVNHIFGIDVDSEACEKAKLGLFLVMMEDVLDFEKRKRVLPSLDNNIICGNTIFEKDYLGGQDFLYCKNPMNPFDKNEGFGALNPMAEQNGIFDIIIGNPPYINVEKLKGKQEKKSKKQRKSNDPDKEVTPVSYLQAKYPLTSEGRTDLYCVFIERGLQLLKRDGVLSFITPDKWYYEPYGKNLREEIVEGHTLDKVVIVGEKVFKSAFRKCPLVPAAITVIKKSGHARDCRTISEDYRTGYRLQFKDGEDETDYFNRFSLAPIAKTGLTDSLADNFSYSFRILSEVERNIITTIDACSIKMGEVVYVNWGLRPKAEKLIDGSKSVPKGAIGIVKGEDFGSGYFTGPANHIVYREANIHPGRMGYPSLMGSRRILIAEVTGEEGIRAVVDSGRNYNDHSVSMSLLYSEIPFEAKRLPSELKQVSDLAKHLATKYSYDFLHGILCSRVTSYYHAKWLTNELNVYPEHVRNLRIPKIETAKNQSHIEGISRALQSFNAIKEGNAKALQTCKKLCRVLDRLAYEEFGLSDEMIEEIEHSFPSDFELPDLTSAVAQVKDLAA